MTFYSTPFDVGDRLSFDIVFRESGRLLLLLLRLLVMMMVVVMATAAARRTSQCE